MNINITKKFPLGCLVFINMKNFCGYGIVEGSYDEDDEQLCVDIGSSSDYFDPDYCTYIGKVQS